MAEVAQNSVGNEIGMCRGVYQVVKNPVYVYKNSNRNSNPGDNSPDDMPAQSFEVINKCHLGIFGVTVLANPFKEEFFF